MNLTVAQWIAFVVAVLALGLSIACNRIRIGVVQYLDIDIDVSVDTIED